MKYLFGLFVTVVQAALAIEAAVLALHHRYAYATFLLLWAIGMEVIGRERN